MTEYYTCRFKLTNGKWYWVEAWNDSPLWYPTLARASESIERIVSFDGIVEGMVYDSRHAVVEHWQAGPWRSSARKVETVFAADPGEPGDGADMG